MEIRLGAEVRGTEGKLGEVHRFIADARIDSVTDLVVKHGHLFGDERVVPLSSVKAVDGGTVLLDIDQRHFEILDGYTDEPLHAPYTSYSGPPGFDRGSFALDSAVTVGGAHGPAAEPPMGYPGGESTAPHDLQRGVIQSGTPVLDTHGAKVGEVHGFGVDAHGGSPLHLTLRHGGLLHHEDVALPPDWIQQLSDKGVVLNVAQARVDEEVERENRSARH
jgi:uncharacterized protein YrrD